MTLLEWVEHTALTSKSNVLNDYRDAKNDHFNLQAILQAIDTGGGQTCDVPKVLIELHNAGFVIVKRTPETLRFSTNANP